MNIYNQNRCVFLELLSDSWRSYWLYLACTLSWMDLRNISKRVITLISMWPECASTKRMGSSGSGVCESLAKGSINSFFSRLKMWKVSKSSDKVRSRVSHSKKEVSWRDFRWPSLILELGRFKLKKADSREEIIKWVGSLFSMLTTPYKLSIVT